MTLLVVEDDDAVADAVVEALATRYAVVAARNGREALDVVAARPVDAILLDLMMPVMDGETFLRAYRAAGGAAPVIVTSAGEDLPGRTRAIGAQDFVRKPYRLDDLLDKLARVTASASATCAADVDAPGTRR